MKRLWCLLYFTTCITHFNFYDNHLSLKALFLFSNYRCFLRLLSRWGRRGRLCLSGAQKEAATNAPTSLRLLLFTVVTHARSDQVSNIRVSEETYPLFHSASPPLWRGRRCAKPLFNWGRTEEAGTRVFSHSSLSGGMWSQMKERGGRKRSWGGGRGMLCERMQKAALSSSCPRVYWSVIALRGEGADH